MLKPTIVINDEMNKHIKGYFKNAKSKDEVVFTFSEGYCLGLNTSRWRQNFNSLVPAHQFGNACNIGARIALNGRGGHIWVKKIVLVDSPMFTLNGHDGISSPTTAKYLRNKAYSSRVAQAFGTVVPAHAQLPGKIASTAIAVERLVALCSMANKSRSTSTVAAWLDVATQMAMRRGAVKGTQMAGTVASCCIPYSGLLATPVVMYLKSGKATYEFVCVYTALELHWRAFQENNFGGVGPATRILHELFRDSKLAPNFGSDSTISKLVKEPAGWIPIKNVLCSL